MGQKAFLQDPLASDIQQFLDRGGVENSVKHSILRLVGIKGKIEKVVWYKPSPPPNLSVEVMVKYLRDYPTWALHVTEILGPRIFVLDHCVKQFQGEEPGIWKMLEAGGP